MINREVSPFQGSPREGFQKLKEENFIQFHLRDLEVHMKFIKLTYTNID